MQKTRAVGQVSAPELDVGPMDLERGFNPPITGEGVSAAALSRFASRGMEVLSAQYGHMSMAKGLQEDPVVLDGMGRLQQIVRRQHELLTAVSKRINGSGNNEL
ncbi:MAG: hypothetical protein V1875_00795 [Candidatus Altiarchaeota archaeon]